MTDIFISYAHEDQDFVRLMVPVLEAEGLSVWWDHTIPPGKSWDSFIAKGIEESRCCIVVWSPHSINSDWVKEEATLGKDAGKMLPVQIGGVEPPVGFRRVQAANLTGWTGDPNHPQWRLLATEAINLARGQGAAQRTHQPRAAYAPPPPARTGGGFNPAVLIVALLAIVAAGAAAYYFTNMRDAPLGEDYAAIEEPAEAIESIDDFADPARQTEVERSRREPVEAAPNALDAEQQAEIERLRRERDAAIDRENQLRDERTEIARELAEQRAAAATASIVGTWTVDVYFSEDDPSTYTHQFHSNGTWLENNDEAGHWRREGNEFYWIWGDFDSGRTSFRATISGNRGSGRTGSGRRLVMRRQ